MKHYNLVATPMKLGKKLSNFKGGASLEANLYQNLIGSLRYLTCTRPDIAYSIEIMSRFMEEPKQSH